MMKMDNYYQPYGTQPYFAPQTQPMITPVNTTPTYTQPSYSQRNWQQQYPVMNQQNYQQQNQQQNNNSNMVWVQGEAGAKAYVLPNNTTLPLWDSEAQVIYIKSVDASGKPSMTILDYVDRNAPVQEEKEKDEYVTKTDLDLLNNKFEAVSEQIDSLNGQVQKIENKIININRPQQGSANNINNRKGNK